MELKGLDFEARKRNAWQVFDLSLLAIHRWGGRMFLLWFLQAIIVFVPVALFFDSFISLIVVWWLKPVFERPLLHYCSQAAFGYKPTVRECFAVIRRLGFSKILLMLTLRRFNLQRAFVAPVDQLEGLAGATRRSRIAVLESLSNHRQTLWLVFCVHVEVLFMMAFSITLFAMIPGGEGIEFDVDLFFLYEDSYSMISVVATLLGYGIVAPYYVTGGFLGYLHSRIELESWDIELAFKRLSKRLLPAASVFFCLILSSTIVENHAYASTLTEADKLSVQADVEEIYQDSEVVVMTKSWRPVLDDVEPTEFIQLEWLVDFLVWLFKILTDDFSWLAMLFWVCIVTLLGFVLWKLLRIPRIQKSSIKTAPLEEMPQFITSVETHEIPEDLLAASTQANALGDSRLALKWILLHALIHAKKHFGVVLHSSMTEQECESVLEKSLPKDTLISYTTLFELWISEAWGHRKASSESIGNLLTEFSNISLNSQQAINR